MFQPHPLLHRIQNGLPENDIETLKSISTRCNFTSTLLPIKSVGVQVSSLYTASLTVASSFLKRKVKQCSHCLQSVLDIGHFRPQLDDVDLRAKFIVDSFFILLTIKKPLIPLHQFSHEPLICPLKVPSMFYLICFVYASFALLTRRLQAMQDEICPV